MRLALAAFMSLAACGGAAAPAAHSAAPATAAEPAPEAAPAPEAPTDPDAPLLSGSAAVGAAPAPAPVPDTPMCRTYKKIVTDAAGKFAAIGAATLPGASSCTVVGGGPGHAATTTFTCEFGTAASATELTPKRDELDRALRSCGSTAAFAATRVRVVASGGATHLVVNIHDNARW